MTLTVLLAFLALPILGADAEDEDRPQLELRTVLEGLRGRAEGLPTDGLVAPSELQAFVGSRVKELAEDQQHPRVPLQTDVDLTIALGKGRVESLTPRGAEQRPNAPVAVQSPDANARERSM